MIKGFKQLKHVEPGELVRLENGTYAMISEYGYSTKSYYDAYILGSGESLIINPNVWVAIVDMDYLEANLEIEYEYPPSPDWQPRPQDAASVNDDEDEKHE